MKNSQKAVWLIVLPLIIFFSTSIQHSEAGSPHEGKSASEVAHELANPNTSLGFFSFLLDYVAYDGDLPDANDQDAWKVSFQPSIPYPIGEGRNFFFRPLIPVFLDQPVFDDGRFKDKGVDLGDIGFDAAIGQTFSSGMVLIGGVAGTLPTATDDDLGPDQLLLGPEGFLGWKFKWGFLGACRLRTLKAVELAVR